MEQSITLSTLIQMGVIFIAFWGFVKVVKEVIKSITDRHDKEQGWDEVKEEVKQLVDNAKTDKKQVYEEIARNVQAERDKIYDRYDSKLTEMEDTINSNHADTEAKFQQVYSELMILTNCMQAVLDGLKQLNCNGKVTTESENLNEYLSKRAHPLAEQNIKKGELI